MAKPKTAADKYSKAELASRKARASRDKGRRGEHLVAKKMRQLWAKVERLIQDRGGRCDGPDLQVVEARLDIEVKHRELSAIRPAIKDAKLNCRPGNTWAAVDWPTGKRGEATITFDLDQWIAFMLDERERAERAGFAAGQQHAAVTGSKAQLEPLSSVGPAKSGSLRDLVGGSK